MVAACTSWIVFTLVSALIPGQLLHLSLPPLPDFEPGMRQGEPRSPEREIIVSYDVEVQCPRAPLVGTADPSGLPLDLEAGLEEHVGRQCRLQEDHLVEI